MKKITQLIVATLMVCTYSIIHAQSPQYVNYQAVARNNSGAPITNSSVALRVSIHNGSAGGAVIYQERDTATTNAHGLFTCKIGAGNVISGTFNTIDWANGEKYMQVELDPTGGSSYTDMGTTQLLSVPYALHSQFAASSQNAVDAQTAVTAQTALVADTALHSAPQPFTTNGNDIYANYTGFTGLGTATPTHKISIVDGFGGRTNLGDHGGWTAIGFANSGGGPYNLVANGGSYLSFLYAPNTTGAITSKMLMDGLTNAFRPTNDNGMSLGVAGTRWTAVYAVNGTIQTSDERYKQNINNLSYGLNEVMQLRPVSYQWKDKKSQLGTGTNLGFVAQELERIVPDLVIHTAVEKDAETGKLPNEYADAYGVKYAEFIPVLTKAIQEQQALIDQLQKEIEILKARQ